MDEWTRGTYFKVIKTGRIGMVEEREGPDITLTFYDKSTIEPELDTFKVRELMKVELPQLKSSQMKPIVRGELSIAEVTSGTNLIPESIEVDSEPCRITVEDLLAGLNQYDGLSTEEIFSWIDFIHVFAEDLSFLNDPWIDITETVSEKDILNAAYEEVDDLKWWISFSKPEDVTSGDLEPLRKILEIWTDSKGTDYPESIKYRIAFQFDEDTIDQQSEKTQLLFKKCLDYLCDEKKEARAIQKRGYCYYCGTKIYPNNWFHARDAFIEYYNMTGDASAANTLGYIYYYGRCNHGVPEYDQAFKYFSIGHAYTYFESSYKLADMLAHGYGVVQNGETANHLYWSVYEKTRDRFVKGDVESQFADAALRMGNCFRDEIGARKDLKTAYYYYLQADYAIRQRIKAANHYGDTVVYSGIQKALASVREEYTERVRTVKFYGPGWTIWTLIDHRRCRLRVKELKNGVLALDLTPVKRYDEEEAPAMLITIPEGDYCELRKKIRIKSAKSSRFVSMNGSPELLFDHVVYDSDQKKTSFYYFEELAGELYTDYCTFRIPSGKTSKKSGKRYHFVSIKFSEKGRAYDYLCEDPSVVPGDWVIVNGYDGETPVEVVDVFDRDASEMGLPIERYKSIVRKASS